MQVAQTILQQLGGKRFLAMTGAYSLVGGNNCLSMRLRRNPKGVAGVRITLDPSDTYTVVALKKKGTLAKGNLEIVESYKISDVYCDMLQDVFTEATGLYTHL